MGKSSTFAVIPAAGSSTRMGLGKNKVFLPLDAAGEPILSRVIQSFVEAGVCAGIVLVVQPAELEAAAALAQSWREKRPELQILTVRGGRTRQESVRLGLTAIHFAAPRWVAIHDGARPFCSPALIRTVCESARATGAAILAVPSKQSLKRSADGRTIEGTIPRADVWEAQTPQVFPYADILQAHDDAAASGILATDDSELFERLGRTVSIVEGSDANLKITTPLDLKLSQVLLDRTAAGGGTKAAGR